MLSYFINTQKFKERKIALCHERKLQSSESSCGTTNAAVVVAFFFFQNIISIPSNMKEKDQ